MPVFFSNYSTFRLEMVHQFRVVCFHVNWSCDLKVMIIISINLCLNKSLFQLEKYQNSEFGTCIRVFCENQLMMPIGLSDQPGIVISLNVFILFYQIDF